MAPVKILGPVPVSKSEQGPAEYPQEMDYYLKIEPRPHNYGNEDNPSMVKSITMQTEKTNKTFFTNKCQLSKINNNQMSKNSDRSLVVITKINNSKSHCSIIKSSSLKTIEFID